MPPNPKPATPLDLPDELRQKIDAIVSRYPESPRAAVLMVLHSLQGRFGYISEDGIRWTAERLGLEPVKVLEVVSFYPGFHQHPVGRLHFRVCRTLSCAMAGSIELMEKLCELKGIDIKAMHGHRNPVLVSDDGEVSVEYAECLAACGFAPVCMVNHDTHEHLTADKAADLLGQYRAKSGETSAAH